MSSAVRRAWLCGQDPLTGKNFNHRKVWIRQRLEFLAGQFSSDICTLAIMSNHVHLVLRTRPDLAGQWTDQEVARRWWNVFPQRKNEDGSLAEPEAHELDRRRADPAVQQERRQRLSSLSAFAFSVVSFHEQALGAHTYVARARTTAELIRGYTLLSEIP